MFVYVEKERTSSDSKIVLTEKYVVRTESESVIVYGANARTGVVKKVRQ